MENKRSIGVTLWAWLFIIGLYGCFKAIFEFEIVGWLAIVKFINCVIGFILGVNLLQLKEWARKGVIYWAIFGLLIIWPYGPIVIDKEFAVQHIHDEVLKRNILLFLIVGSLIFNFILIYFFTRLKVKEQFKDHQRF